SPGQHRAAARPRLPRAERQVVRRPWQLRHGPQGAARVPRDRLRQGRPGARHGHHHLHDGEDGRGSQGASPRLRLPVRELRPETQMAKTSSVEKNNRRIKMAKQYAAKRAKLKEMAVDDKLQPEERFAARLKLAELPRNSSPTRVRNRCEITGRPRAVYRKFKLSRLALRELASSGGLPGVVKSSWSREPVDHGDDRSRRRFAYQPPGRPVR